MSNIIILVQILLAVFLMGVILLQARGTGLGQAWGGGGEFYRSKRGLEKILFRATVILAVAFFIWSVLSILLQ